MSPTPPPRHVLALVLCTALPFAQAQATRFDGYEAFYRSLGDNTFEGPGSPLHLACTEAQQCLWVNAMAAAVKRYDSELWSVPGELPDATPAGMPEIAFDGQRLDIGERHWLLGEAVELAPAQWRVGASMDPEELYGITAWRRGEAYCLELPAGQRPRRPLHQVLLVHDRALYDLPRCSRPVPPSARRPQAASYPAMPTWKKRSITSRLACGWTTCNPAARHLRNTIACSSPTRRTPSCSKSGSRGWRCAPLGD